MACLKTFSNIFLQICDGMRADKIPHKFLYSFHQVDVVVRFDLGPTQRELFIREAKIMTGLHHDYIMKFYGAVILGSYTDSVGLVQYIFFIFNCHFLLANFLKSLNQCDSLQ